LCLVNVNAGSKKFNRKGETATTYFNLVGRYVLINMVLKNAQTLNG